MISDLPEHDTAAAVDFLCRIQPGGPWHLVSIVNGKGPQARTFTASERGAMSDWIEERQGEANLYFHVNPLYPGVRNRKAKKVDVASARYLHIDVDDASAKERIEAFSPPPTVVVWSGGGYHCYWHLTAPCGDLERVENLNRWLALQLGGDDCHNVDRILRLPGTLNLPNAKKQATGRKIAQARLMTGMTDWSRVYGIEDFEAPEPPPSAPARREVDNEVRIAGLDDLPTQIGNATRVLIQHGQDPERPIGSPGARYPSRSEVVFRVTLDLLRGGCAPGLVTGILLNPDLGISASIIGRRDAARYAARQVVRAQHVLAEGWPDRSKTGAPRPTLRNTVLAIDRLGIACCTDRFHNRKVVNGQVLQTYQGDLSDDICDVLRKLILDRFGFDPNKENARDAVNTLCLENSFDPVLDYLDQCVWDGVPRLDTWLVTYFGAEDTTLNRAIGRKMLIAAVRRVKTPGIKFDTIVVLEGKQGTGKSTALRVMAGDDNFSDQDILTLDAKAQMEGLEGVWIYEICELEGISRADTNKVKAFASRSVDRARPAYGRFRENRPRRAIFVGTTNDSQYLRDMTGNRRFWPVATGLIDLTALKRDRDQLWAEAAHLEKSHEPVTLPENLWPVAEQEQELRLEDDPWLGILVDHNGMRFGEQMRMPSEQLLSVWLNIPPDRQVQHHTKRLAMVMRKLGWEGPQNLKFDKGKVARGYRRQYEPSRDDEQDPLPDGRPAY